MEIPKEYHYTYYSYEEWGMGYFGSRTCKCIPEEDVNYFGTYSHKNFNPTQKIILKSDYDTRKEAIRDEISLQQYYKVVENSHFANRAYQTSTGFYCNKGPSKEANKRRSEMMKTSYNPMSNPEYREKARVNSIKTLSKPEVRKKKSETAKRVFNEPEMAEKRRQSVIKSHQNPETKRKHIEAKLGAKNPCYGKRWITNGKENKYINSIDEVPSDFRYGRVL